MKLPKHLIPFERLTRIFCIDIFCSFLALSMVPRIQNKMKIINRKGMKNKLCINYYRKEKIIILRIYFLSQPDNTEYLYPNVNPNGLNHLSIANQIINKQREASNSLCWNQERLSSSLSSLSSLRMKIMSEQGEKVFFSQ